MKSNVGTNFKQNLLWQSGDDNQTKPCNNLLELRQKGQEQAQEIDRMENLLENLLENCV